MLLISPINFNVVKNVKNFQSLILTEFYWYFVL